jgi:lysophospholipase L1-like esterase
LANGPRMKRTLLALLTALPFFTACAQDNPAVVPAERNKEKWWADRHQAKLNDPKRAEAKVVFLGDSITQGWEGAGKATWEKAIAPLGSLNLGYSGDRTEHALWRIDNGELDGLKPKLVVILLGTNNIGHKKSNPAQTTEGMKEILARIAKKLPETKVLLLGVFPRGKTADDAMRKGAAEITQLYSKLADGKSVQFLDINGKLSEPDGSLNKDVMPDYLHLSPKGYEMWAEAMMPKVKEMVQ